jgi:hypothetical protein
MAVVIFSMACLVPVSLLASGVEVTGDVGSDAEYLRIQVRDARVKSLRVEVFDGEGGAVYDSGIVAEGSFDLPLEEVWARVESQDALALEIRAWDYRGELLVSQLTRGVNLGEDVISTIQFDSIPGNTTLLGESITLSGDVLVNGSLDAASGIQTSSIQASGGGSFFGTCGAGSSIRSINASGAVTCEFDDVGGGGGGDNLGNHTATTNLQMGSNMILFDIEHGLRGAGGGEVKTGPLGRTFQFFAGASGADSARFWNSAGALRIAIPEEGGLDFWGGQKVCSVYDGSGRHSILAGASWTTSDCNDYRVATAPEGAYQVFCVFHDGFSFGGANGTAPPARNCGW